MNSSDRFFQHVCENLLSIATGDDIKKLQSILAQIVKSKWSAKSVGTDCIPIPQLNSSKSVPKQTISCQYCGKVFTQKSHRNHHQTGGYCKPKDTNKKPAQNVMAPKVYQCPICCVITTKEKLRNHFRLSAKEKTYKPTKGGKMGRPEIHKQEPREKFLVYLKDLKKNPETFEAAH